MRIVLVRHGETDWNKKELFRGRADIPLNTVGIQQVTKTAQHLKILNLSIKKIYSSPLQRTRETAQVISNQLEIQPVEIIEEFIDFNYGQWEGQPIELEKKKYPDIYKKWQEDPLHAVIPEGESLQDVKKRVKKGLDFVLKEAKDQNIVIVSHKIIIKIIIGFLAAWDEKNYLKIEKDLASISIIEIDQGKASVHVLNDIGHLLRR